ncbi:WD40-repeat-containing domain protein, partial [Protomyces lactucae-debilis]
SSDEDDEGDVKLLPCSHEIKLGGHSRPVSGLALDPSGARVVTGSRDGQLCLWDFGGMSAERRPFKTTQTQEGHQIRACSFNATGRLILVVAATWQPTILTRDGDDVGQIVRGDPYLRDLKGTAGHVSECTGGAWHPKLAEQCASSSADSTIRLWDVNNFKRCKQVLVHKARVAGQGKIKCSAMAYSTDGKMIGGAYADGTLSLWSTDGPTHRPMGGIVLEAHGVGDTVTGLAFSQDGHSFASRGASVVKLWDQRMFKSPIHSTNQPLPNRDYEETNVLFSPNNQQILTPTSQGSSAHIAVFSSKTLDLLQRIAFSSPCMRVDYHAKLDQILAAHADGTVSVLFDPDRSSHGAKLVLAKAPKHRHVDDLAETMAVETIAYDADAEKAGADPVLGGGSSAMLKRMQTEARKDPKRSHRPDLPSDERKLERKVIDSARQYLEEDPREALLKYDQKAKEKPMFTSVYGDAPTIFAEPDEQEDD